MPSASPGRPRSAAVERAIVDAVLVELQTVGYHGLTIETVARRAGVGRPTIYRRWPDRDALVVGALIATVPPLTPATSDDPVADLRASASAFLAGIAHSPAARAVLAVHAVGAHRPDLRAALHEHYLAPRAEALAGTIARARTAGAIRPEVTDDQVRDLLFGPAVYRWLMLGDVPDEGETGALLDLALAAVGPRSDSPPS
ncbi:TetR family transcriptional regulator [Tsukamurella pulmonis]|uniref:DNA-binding transcriptional regulator, AcrR family n=1 Tax=Tsukamurella pulmonis TaxID=47312 RepID=A0A1H1GHE6_9ACTN|nr:TetR/AcrR family transcriptional regulator [Tsukamurella pulmonis]KXO88518.1 hypothetical protein AXK56_11190 [Tsukamurella pulmonis]BDD81803.1 TetR family transcriptional regulator [Tsukamurella pulmonis]SDR12587.1 DNA-binding transcriptional regulator, AcrR family [Tsukamurella pulmonis]SUP17283.1 Bacterial regulatory proteins, tetR family [Tsukamurella pulmonis]